MSETQDNAFMRFLNERLVPFSTKVSQNRYIQAIGQGSMGLMAVILVGAVFNLLNTLPIEPYQALLTSTGIGDAFGAIYNAAMNFMGLFMVASVARAAARSFGHEELAIENMFLALMGYLILVPLTTNDAGDSIINMNYLGSRGTFMAFIVAIVTTKINIAVVERHLVIKMPDGVPDSVGKTFTAIVPGAISALVFALVRLGFSFTSYGNVIDAVYSILQTPLAGITGSLPGFIILVTAANLLWFVGVHGSYTVFGVQNYTRTVFGPDGELAPEPSAELTQMGYEFYPQGLENVIRRVHESFPAQLMITENGIATADDARRVAYIDAALEGVRACVEDGIDVAGYLYWSLIDNYEWQSGYSMQFGLMDRDGSHAPKPSLGHLGKRCREWNEEV